jgi:cytoskeletal protein CcmA (bactofilin family)
MAHAWGGIVTDSIARTVRCAIAAPVVWFAACGFISIGASFPASAEPVTTGPLNILGSAVVRGPVTVEGPLKVGGNLAVHGPLTAERVAQLQPDEAQRRAGDNNFYGPLTVKGPLVVRGDLEVRGPLTVKGPAGAVGKIDVDGPITERP